MTSGLIHRTGIQCIGFKWGACKRIRVIFNPFNTGPNTLQLWNLVALQVRLFCSFAFAGYFIKQAFSFIP